MAFLAPLFLAGLAALALPVLLHLRRNRPKETVVFSSLMFFEEQPPVTQRRSRLQDLVLLMLRCLALALLVLAFARPFFPATEDSPTPVTHSALHLILIDTSASMRGEPLEKALALAKDTIDAVPEEDAIAVATFSEQATFLLDPERARRLVPGERRSTAIAMLGEIRAGWNATRADAAILSAVAAAGSDSAVNLHLIGDLQKGSTLDRLRGESWPDGLRIQLHPIAPKDGWTNAGVRMLPAERQTQRVRVTNAEGSAKSEFTLDWTGGGKAPVTVLPGDSAVFEAPAGIPAEGKVTLSGDDFPFDNDAAWVTAPLAVLKIWRPDPADATDITETGYFLQRAMQPTADYSVEIVAAPPAELPALTITDGRASDAAALRRVIEAGGTALFTLRDATSASLLSQVLETTGQATEASVKDHARFGEIDFKSPVFSAFAEARYSDFSGIRIWKYRILSDPLVAKAKVLARFDTGDPAWLSYSLGKGTLQVLTTTWRPADSQLALTTKFAPLLHSLLAAPAQGRGIHLVGFEGIDSPGIHRWEDRRIAVQLDPAESEITPLAESDFRALGLPLDVPVVVSPTATTLALSNAEQESRQRIGWWLIAAAALVFMAETAWAARTGGHANPTPA